jgi:phage shock protein A
LGSDEVKYGRFEMALMERVAMLLRANVNDLIDRAEDPEKMVKQLLLDMENQLMQVKTQVAIAIADEHLLEKRRKEQADAAANWRAKAELAVSKGEDELARLALERALSHDLMESGFAQQAREQASEAASLRTSYKDLQNKLMMSRAQCEMLIAQHRRARTAGKATRAQRAMEDTMSRHGGVLGEGAGTLGDGTVGRFTARIQNAEAENHAGRAMLQGETLEGKFAKLERDDRVERLLEELKEKRLLEA